MGVWEGAQSPSGKGYKEGGYPPPPLLLEVGNPTGGDGKARDQVYKTWDRSPVTVVCNWSCFKMADSLPELPFGISLFSDDDDDDDDVSVPGPFPVDVLDNLPELPEEIYLIIARKYRLATAVDRAAGGWYRVHAEMRQLPRCPKRKRIINLRGFHVPRHGNLLQPVTGYFFRRLMRLAFAQGADPRLYRWFLRVFGGDDYLRANQAVEWPYVFCRHCHAVHECGNEEEEEERRYQKDQRAYRKKMRRVANVWAQRDWLTRLRPRRRRPKT